MRQKEIAYYIFILSLLNKNQDIVMTFKILETLSGITVQNLQMVYNKIAIKNKPSKEEVCKWMSRNKVSPLYIKGFPITRNGYYEHLKVATDNKYREPILSPVELTIVSQFLERMQTTVRFFGEKDKQGYGDKKEWN
jgi:hypothetical protein